MSKSKEHAIEHWKWIIRAVFTAEHTVRPSLAERKASLPAEPTQEEIELMCDNYVRDIAIEIIKHTSDEEIEEYYGNNL